MEIVVLCPTVEDTIYRTRHCGRINTDTPMEIVVLCPTVEDTIYRTRHCGRISDKKLGETTRA